MTFGTLILSCLTVSGGQGRDMGIPTINPFVSFTYGKKKTKSLIRFPKKIEKFYAAAVAIMTKFMV